MQTTLSQKYPAQSFKPSHHIHQPAVQNTSSSRYGSAKFALFISAVSLFLIILIKSETAVDFKYSWPLFAYTIFVTTFQLSRVLGAVFYTHQKKNSQKAVEKSEPANDYEPTVTFVVPCKNEEGAIENTVRKCFAADYPKEKLEVIIINDGSTDRTGEILKELQKEFSRLVVVDWKVNRGKRHGMYEGFKQAQGEIVVQLDSDSYIDPTTFRKLIEPFRDPKIGAVCAHADPANADTNFLTKMQAAYYFMSFRILKAAESAFSCVFCCSGCSSAYRRSIVMPIMDEWLNESFLGRPITWGDDRALTNWVLKLGYQTIYTDDVKAFTICPETFRQFLKQQVRWKKGWFVNSIIASKFIFKREPFVSVTYFFPLIFVTLTAPFMAVRALIYNPVAKSVMPYYYLAGMLLVAIIIVIYYRYVNQENKYWPYLFAWTGINTIVLSFILFYALASIQNRKWGTR